jgi:hypothetical protein
MTFLQTRIAPRLALIEKQDGVVLTPGASSQSGSKGEPFPAACPKLGLSGDLATRALFPTLEHRCYAARAWKPSMAHQALYCLGDRFYSCREFQRYGHRATGSHAVSALAARLRRLSLGTKMLVASVLSILMVLALYWLIGLTSSDLGTMLSKWT